MVLSSSVYFHLDICQPDRDPCGWELNTKPPLVGWQCADSHTKFLYQIKMATPLYLWNGGSNNMLSVYVNKSLSSHVNMCRITRFSKQSPEYIKLGTEKWYLKVSYECNFWWRQLYRIRSLRRTEKFHIQLPWHFLQFYVETKVTGCTKTHAPRSRWDNAHSPPSGQRWNYSVRWNYNVTGWPFVICQ